MRANIYYRIGSNTLQAYVSVKRKLYISLAPYTPSCLSEEALFRHGASERPHQ